MAIVPTTEVGRITFYESHIDEWTARAIQIGLSDSDCASLAERIAAARAAYNQQHIAIAAARSATEAMHQAVGAMHALGAADIAKIKAFADATSNPNVFPLASIPAPAAPAPVGPPGRPYGFTIALAQDGSLTLKWKCRNPVGTTGTIYEVWRRIGAGGAGGAGGAFEFLGSRGTKSFTDAKIPAALGGAITYQIIAVRSTKRGDPAQFNVNFGVAARAAPLATEAKPMKMAA